MNPQATLPWFHQPAGWGGERHAAIIGAGFAGTAAAFSLAKRGWHVSLIDRHPQVAGEASGNPAAVIMPLPALKPGWRTEFHQQAFEAFLRRVNELRQLGHDSGYLDCGVLSLIEPGELWSETPYYQPLTQAEAEARAGCSLPGAALWLPRAGRQPAAQLCRAQLAASSAELIGGCEVARLERTGSDWRLLDADDQLILSAPVVVIASGYDAARLEQTRGLALRPLRGQVTALTSDAISQRPNCAICGEGYVAPLPDGGIVTGASYQPGQTSRETREEDRQYNLGRLQQLMPEIEVDRSVAVDRASVRASTPDRIPLLGPIPDWQYYLDQYEGWHHGRSASSFGEARYQPGLYAIAGLGSRGGTTAPLLGELLAEQLDGKIIGDELWRSLHPARHLMSALKKQPEHRGKNLSYQQLTADN